MCIRDSAFDEAGFRALEDERKGLQVRTEELQARRNALSKHCLLYTSDAADERSSVDLGGRRIIQKKKKKINYTTQKITITTSLTAHVIHIQYRHD